MDLLVRYCNCPSRRVDDFTVIFGSSMGDDDLRKGIKTVYMLWGSHMAAMSGVGIVVSRMHGSLLKYPAV